MNDWLHCNKCFMKFQSDIKLYLRECTHIFCEKCIHTVGSGTCFVCQKSNSFILIGKDMHSSAQPFFISFEMHMKKMMEIYTFQNWHRQRLNQSQADKYQYAKGQLFSCYNKLKAVVSENRIMRNMLMNNNRNSQTNSRVFINSTPSVTTDGMSDFAPVIQKNKQMPGYAQRLQEYKNNMNGISIQQSQSGHRNIHPTPNFMPGYPTVITDDNMSQVNSEMTPMKKNKQTDGYPQIFQNYGGNMKGGQIPYNQPHLHSGGMYYRPSPDSTVSQNLAHIRRHDIPGVHGDHIPPNTANSMRELHGKRT